MITAFNAETQIESHLLNFVNVESDPLHLNAARIESELKISSFSPPLKTLQKSKGWQILDSTEV